jgi:hypothetical protein
MARSQVVFQASSLTRLVLIVSGRALVQSRATGHVGGKRR